MPSATATADAKSGLLLELPVVRPHATRCAPVRKSRRGIYRAISLLAVHLAVAAHIAHWKISGKTITPVEPSEAMQTLELGYLNAGFILFVFLIFSTLLLGRWFCGWACHVVAYQDACAWLLKKVGLRPRPVRSRLLVFIPVFAALYMFVWPQVLRLFEGREFPPIVLHLSTASFWRTFPGPVIGGLTFLVDGFLLVYLLGAKGFCTYGCPYGAVFAAADRFAPGKIRVTDACEGCGHCTATCTSNVRVHEEVARFGMVVDPGCMKCMDCVNVCPKDALYFGFGKPSLLTPKAKPRRLYDFSWGEEIAMAAVFLFGLYAFRDLYGAIPFFFAIGLSVVAAIASVTGWRLLRRREMAFQHHRLRSGGHLMGAGLAALSFAAVFLLFAGHSALVQYQKREGVRFFEKAMRMPREERREVLSASLGHLLAAERLGVAGDGSVENMIGQILTHQGNRVEAERRLRRAIDLTPELTVPRLALADLLIVRGAYDEAESVLRDMVRVDPETPFRREADLRLEGLRRQREAAAPR